ncbi:recombination regulator RecX [Clostridium polynesiense]|uniref:recombination regulator RecX n=1 Tax=Clostridium polynesiense TaxID=1325933 RepID=UPI00058B12F8|nr:recombination regulator RecX [Clostridium polynesiense]
MDNKITKIEVQKRNKNRVNVYIDGEYKFSCHTEIVFKHNLSEGREVDIKYLEDIVKEDNFLKAKSAAFKIIEKSYKTEKEIEDKLILKGFDKETVEKIKALLKEYDFMNDEKYVKAFIKDNLKKQGKRKMLYSLSNKGVEEGIIKKELDKIQKKDLEKYAEEIAYKKYSQLKKRESDKWKLANKLTSFMLSKGYEYEMVKDIVKKIMNIYDVD